MGAAPSQYPGVVAGDILGNHTVSMQCLEFIYRVAFGTDKSDLTDSSMDPPLVKLMRSTCFIVVSSWLKWGKGVKISGRFIDAGGHNWNLWRLVLFNIQNGRISGAMLCQVAIFRWPLK